MYESELFCQPLGERDSLPVCARTRSYSYAFPFCGTVSHPYFPSAHRGQRRYHVKMCILVVLIRYAYHIAQFKKCKVCIVTGLQAGQVSNRGPIPGSSKRLFAFSKMARSVPGIKWLGHEPDHSCTSDASMCLNGVHRGNYHSITED
jgi:hypothetical protein